MQGQCYRYNQLNPNDLEAQRKILSGLLGRMGENVIFTPPFWCDYGYNISVGDFFYSNHNLIITDGAEVTFGNNVFIAPNCCFTTAEHAIDPQQRRDGLEIAKPITVGNNVWIGAGRNRARRRNNWGQFRDRRGKRGDEIHSRRRRRCRRALQGNEKNHGGR